MSSFLQFSTTVKELLQEAQLLLGDRATRKHAKDRWNWRGNDNLGWNDLQMYFKVIKSGTNRKLVYNFLSVVYSNFCRITHRFWEIWCETVQWPWNMPKVIDSGIAWKLWCGHVRKMFGKNEWNENRHFQWPHSHLTPHFQRTPENICINLILPETTFPGSIWIALQIFEQLCPKAGDTSPLVAEPET